MICNVNVFKISAYHWNTDTMPHKYRIISFVVKTRVAVLILSERDVL